MGQIDIQDSRIQSLVDRTLDHHHCFNSTELDVAKYTEWLVKETVEECMKQIALTVNMSDPAKHAIVISMWDHLAKRFLIGKKNA